MTRRFALIGLLSTLIGAGPYMQDWPTWLDNRFIDTVTADGADAPRGVAAPFHAPPQQ